MREHYDDAFWQVAFPKPDWYLDVIPQFTRLEALALQEPDYDKRKAIKDPMYQAVAMALCEGRIALATEGEDHDAAHLFLNEGCRLCEISRGGGEMTRHDVKLFRDLPTLNGDSLRLLADCISAVD